VILPAPRGLSPAEEREPRPSCLSTKPSTNEPLMKTTIAIIGAGPGLGLASARRFGAEDLSSYLSSIVGLLSAFFYWPTGSSLPVLYDSIRPPCGWPSPRPCDRSVPSDRAWRLLSTDGPVRSRRTLLPPDSVRWDRGSPFNAGGAIWAWSCFNWPWRGPAGFSSMG
jgi:hypothetical protein